MSTSQNEPAAESDPTPGTAAHLTRFIARIGSGDDDAVAEFLDLYGNFIRRHIRREMRHAPRNLRRVVRDSDIAQSAFFAFVQAAREGKLYAQHDWELVQYVLSCARNKVLYYVRWYSAARRDINRVVDEPVESLAYRIAAPNKEEPPIDRQLMHDALQQLRGGHALLMQRWLAGHPCDGLADLFETTPGAIRGRLHRLLDDIARFVKHADPEAFEQARPRHPRKPR